MQYLEISTDMTLSDLVERIGSGNIDNTLAVNNLTRSPDIGSQISDMIQDAYQNSDEVDWQRKATILNKFVSDDDIFETVALMNSSDWKVLSTYDMIPGYITIPDTVEIPDANDVLGSGTSIGSTVYDLTMESLYTEPHEIDPSIFNEYSTMKNTQLSPSSEAVSNVMNWFPIPWGEVTLYSDLSGDSIDFPCYPEEISDQTSATYDSMQDLLYVYEPWQFYHSSGPRTVSLTFPLHRDMWTGDHADGKANELIRFCESFCYPEYDGSAVYTDTCSLYISGSCFIHGIITDVSPNWSGPFGCRDSWYLYCELKITFTEIAQEALSRTSVRNKGLIG